MAANTLPLRCRTGGRTPSGQLRISPLDHHRRRQTVGKRRRSETEHYASDRVPVPHPVRSIPTSELVRKARNTSAHEHLGNSRGAFPSPCPSREPAGQSSTGCRSWKGVPLSSEHLSSRWGRTASSDRWGDCQSGLRCGADERVSRFQLGGLPCPP